MKYLLDTDHISVLQLQAGPAYTTLRTRMAQHPRTDTGFAALVARRVRVRTMARRIATIALARGLVVLTRHARDFGQGPGLQRYDLVAGEPPARPRQTLLHPGL